MQGAGRKGRRTPPARQFQTLLSSAPQTIIPRPPFFPQWSASRRSDESRNYDLCPGAPVFFWSAVCSATSSENRKLDRMKARGKAGFHRSLTVTA
jgi:hypothetical protein